MSGNDRSIPEEDARLENLAAELTPAVYPIVLRGTPKERWMKLELGLWRELADTVKRWVGRLPPPEASNDLEAWREGFLVDLIDSAFYVAVKNGIKGSLLELELSLYRAIRFVTRRRARVICFHP